MWDNTIILDAYEDIVFNNSDRDFHDNPIFWADTFNLSRRPGKVYQDLVNSMRG